MLLVNDFVKEKLIVTWEEKTYVYITLSILIILVSLLNAK